MNKYSKLVSDTAIFGIGNFITKLIYFFLMPIYTLSLSAYDFGLADLLNNSLQLIIPIFTLCISDAVFRYSLDEDIKPESIIANGIKILNYSFLIVSIVSGLAFIITGYLYWILLGVLYFVESIKGLFAQFTRGLGLVKIYAYNGVIAAVILLIATYLFLRIIPMGINGYLLAFILADVSSITYLLARTKILFYLKKFHFDKILLKSMLVFSLPLIPNMLSWWLTNISSRYVIALFCGISDSGFYAAASKLPALINVLASIFQLSWQYASVKEYKESSNSDFYSIVFQYYTVFITICGSFILCFIQPISSIVLKGQFYEAWIYSPLLIFSAILGCYSIFFGTFYSVVKDNRKAMITTLIGALSNLIISFATIHIWGVWSAVIANVISYAVIVGLRIHDCRSYVRIQINWYHTLSGVALLLMESVLLSFSTSDIINLVYICPILSLLLYLKPLARVIKYIINK